MCQRGPCQPKSPRANASSRHILSATTQQVDRSDAPSSPCSSPCRSQPSSVGATLIATHDPTLRFLKHVRMRYTPHKNSALAIMGSSKCHNLVQPIMCMTLGSVSLMFREEPADYIGAPPLLSAPLYPLPANVISRILGEISRWKISAENHLTTRNTRNNK